VHISEGGNLVKPELVFSTSCVNGITGEYWTNEVTVVLTEAGSDDVEGAFEAVLTSDGAKILELLSATTGGSGVPTGIIYTTVGEALDKIKETGLNVS